MNFDPFSAGFDLAKTALDKIFPDADTELKGKLDAVAAEVANQFQLQIAQLEINKVEAGSASWFTSNWRPAAAWTCVTAFFYSTIVEPIARFAATVIFSYAGTFPVIDNDLTFQLLLALLGLGTMRSFDKTKGTVKS